MKDVNELERRIREKLADAESRLRSGADHVHQRMLEIEQRHQRFTETADRLMRTVIRPRLEKLAECFDNAKVPDEDQAGRHHCLCHFRRSERFPATTKLELALTHSGQWENLIVQYRLEILPVFIQFKDQGQLTLPLDRVDDAQVAAWVDDRILDFVDTYLRLPSEKQYQSENLTTDPVCGMRINRLFAAATAEYEGRTYYFCVEDCRQKFLANPRAYLEGNKAGGGAGDLPDGGQRR
jgi:YHS domain-containing protein